MRKEGDIWIFTSLSFCQHFHFARRQLTFRVKFVWQTGKLLWNNYSLYIIYLLRFCVLIDIDLVAYCFDVVANRFPNNFFSIVFICTFQQFDDQITSKEISNLTLKFLLQKLDNINQNSWGAWHASQQYRGAKI